jgi:acetyltransferase-like isoleucine patch superfamily enzyme
MTDLAELYGSVIRGDGVVVGEHAVLGCPKEARIDQTRTGGNPGAGSPVRIGAATIVMHHVTVYEGVSIGADCVVEDRVRVGYDCVIGERSRLIHGAYLCDRVEIGEDCRIAGFVCDGVRIGDGSTVMGQLVHEYTQPHLGWWAVDEAPPVIHDHSVVGFGAVVVGGVHIGPRAYVAAGAIVTRDVPPDHVATGTNSFTPTSRWPGRRLQPLISAWRSGG